MTKNIPCHLDKHRGHKDLLRVKDHGVRNLGTNTAGTVTQRYYKGVMADADNMVIVMRRMPYP